MKIEPDKMTNDASLFIGQSCFGNDGLQNFLIFQLIYKTCKMSSGFANTIVEKESKWLSNKQLSLLLQQIIIFLQNWDEWIIQE